jgi:N-acyl-phosphatidylethanolamine-hydrolysing phospholipase D
MTPDHHAGERRYRNPHSVDRHGGIGLLRFLGRWASTPRAGEPPQPVRPDLAFIRGNRSVRAATWLGHASYLVQMDGINLLTDPHFSPRALPLPWAGPERLIPVPVEHAALPLIDVVLISHNHYDHLDAPTLRWLAESHAPLFVVPLGVAPLLRRLGAERVVELDWWGRHRRGGLQLTAVPAQHFSGRGIGDRNATLWCGYVFEADGRRAYFAGDTGYSPDFAEIGRRCAPLDLALLPIGAYEPRSFMRSMHVNPEEAVQIHRDVGSRLSLAMHWGTFRLTLEPLDEPPLRLAMAREAAGLAAEAFQVPLPGETVFW